MSEKIYVNGSSIKAKDGQFLVDTNSSVPISKDQFKLLLGGKAGTKQLNKEIMFQKEF